MSRTLNEITQDIAKYHEALNAQLGEVRLAADSLGMTEEEFIANYDRLAFEDASKLDAYVQSIEFDKADEAAAQAMVDQWEERIKEWRARVKEKQRSQEWKKGRLKFNLQVKGETKVITDSGRVISVVNNGGQAPLVIDEEKYNHLDAIDLDDLEKMGVVVMQPMLDKKKLYDMIQNGANFQWATLGERGTHLRIK